MLTSHSSTVGLTTSVSASFKSSEKRFRLVLDLFAIRFPELRNAAQYRNESGTPRDVGRREIGPASERLELGRQPYAHRPAAVAGRGLDKGHVDLVNVGALFPIDLNADEVLVQESGNGRGLERFVLHDVAPMAGRVTDRKKDGLVLGASLGEGVLAPRIPVDRVLGVLEEVRRFFTGETIGRRLRRHKG